MEKVEKCNKNHTNIKDETMIEQIEDLPDNALGFSAKGVVTKADYETIIIPAVEAKLSKYGKVRLLYH